VRRILRPAIFFAIVTLLPLLPSRAAAQYRYPPGYPGYRYAEPEADVRIQVKPAEASVYVDGYFAGKVEDFDGAFQRLHVTPGEHEIVVYLEGYRSLHQKLYLSPHGNRKIEGTLERLSPGEEQEAAPVPTDKPETRDPDARRSPDSYRRPVGRRPMPRPDGPPPETRRERPAEPPTASSTSAVLSIRVQPGGATVFIDDERWAGPSNTDERLLVQVQSGRHQIRVERDGYQTFTTEVEVVGTQTTPVNISLTKAR
jgi:hypothetical protein